MKYSLIELLDLEKIDNLLEGFNQSTGFVTAILDLNGKVLYKSGWRDICTNFHRVNPETSKRCNISDTELAGKLAEGEEYHFYKCLNGMVDVAIPIVINGEHIANLFSGQFFLEEPDYEFFRKQAREYGFDEKSYLEALAKIPVESKEKVLIIVEFLHNMTQLLIETAINKLEQTELNRSLKESEERFQLLFNEAPLGYQSLDFDGNFLEVNQKWLDTLGYDKSEVIGRWFGDFLTPEYRDGFRKRFPIFKERGTIHSEFEMTHKNGSILFIAFDGRIGHDLKGEFIQTHCILQDITERKQWEHLILKKTEEIEFNNQRLESLFKISQYQTNSIQELLDFALNEAIKLTNSKIGYIYFYNEVDKHFVLNTWSNDVMQECKVMNPQTIYELDKTGCWGEAVRQRKPIIINDYQADNSFKKGVPEGHVKLVKFLTIPVFSDDKIVAVAGVANKDSDYDNSDVRQLNLLMDSVWKISERILLIKDLTIAKEKAEESDRLKSAFLANMSHEIRTPMNGILGFAELLKVPGLSGEEQLDYIRIIEKSGTHMLKIINDIVDISKIEAGLMKNVIQEFNLNEQIEYVYNFFKPEAEAKGIKLIFGNSLSSKDIILKSDREKIYAVLSNLVKNAIKYTNEGSIEFGYSKKADNLEFYVKDTGIGIPKEREEAIFERFIQADIDDINVRQGAGLGLAIAKSYIQMLGGIIWVESEVGVGSTFYFTIPFNSDSLCNDSLPHPVRD
ncbi:MAG: hypothetical protein CVU13_04805 [Bacteroidetes bacterium HGW-Bacteroidetes-8]|jgi:PAS domain S-box-containing protein|nr:MAG: hypothetical protein CVU13_04805 [Bacteroidetes bacterium HGW-Bacteroidetes-8]